MQGAQINSKKEIDRKKIMEDILIKKMGLNASFKNCSMFIHELFSKYLNIIYGNIYFDGDSIICSSDVPGTSPYTITINESGNLRVTYMYESISTDDKWPQHFKIQIEVFYIPKENGYQEITKTSHLYKGMKRTNLHPDGEMVSELTSIDFVVREIENNIEIKKSSLTILPEKDVDI